MYIRIYGISYNSYIYTHIFVYIYICIHINMCIYILLYTKVCHMGLRVELLCQPRFEREGRFEERGKHHSRWNNLGVY